VCVCVCVCVDSSFTFVCVLFLFCFCFVFVGLVCTWHSMLVLFIAADFGYVCVVLVFFIFHSRNKPCKIFRAWGYSLHAVMEIVRFLLVCRKPVFISLVFEHGDNCLLSKGTDASADLKLFCMTL